MTEWSDWRGRVEKELGDESFDSCLVHTLRENIAIEPLYAEGDRPPSCGVWPHTSAQDRRPHAPPALSTYLCHPDPEVAVSEMVRDLEGGASSAWFVLDRAGRLARTHDAGLVGKNGIALRYAVQLRTALAAAGSSGLVAVDAGANILPTAALLIAALDCFDDEGDLRAVCHFDPLGSLAKDGELPGSLEALMGEGRAVYGPLMDRKVESDFVASGLPYHQAGADAADELAYTLATNLEYIRLNLPRVNSVDTPVDASIRLAVGADLFLGIAKLRAARVLWARVLAHMSDVFQSGGWDLNVHAIASPLMVTKKAARLNLLRNGSACFAASCGGADLFSPIPYDWALSIPGDEGRRLARNTYHLLQEEAYLGAVADPAAGSFFLEQLTHELARAAWTRFREIEAEGGMVNALLSGWIQQRLAERREDFHLRLGGLDRVVGVTDFVHDDIIVEIARPDLSGLCEPEAQAAPTVNNLGSAVVAAAEGASLAEISVALERGPRLKCEPLPAVSVEQLLDGAS